MERLKNKIKEKDNYGIFNCVLHMFTYMIIIQCIDLLQYMFPS